MDHDERDEAAALRAFANQVLRGQVDSDHLDGFICELLEIDLVELPAVCRCEAKLLSNCRLRLSPLEAAHLLYHRANQIEGIA